MNIKKILRKTAILTTPLLLFVILFIPYNWLNQNLIVEWLGCGCPKIDVNGNIINSYFNANDFTLLFWLFISICSTILSIFLSKKLLKTKILIRIIYVIVIFIISLTLSYLLFRLMMWR